jgi:hypothetical protein
VALICSTGLCVYASQSAATLISYKTAVQISGWLCLAAVLVGFCPRVARNRRHLGEVTAAATAFFAGVAMLYLSYFQWSELPTALAAPVAAKSAPGVWNPAESAAPAVAWSRSSAAAGGSAPIVPRVAPVAPRLAQQPAEPMVAAAPVSVAAVPMAALPVAKEDGCASLTGLSRFFCQERLGRESCGSQDDADSTCPSVIPASPPR